MENIIINTIAEIQVQYVPSIPESDRIIISDSSSVHRCIRPLFDPNTLAYREDFFALFLDRRNALIGYLKHSFGSDVATTVSVKQLLGVGVKVNACGIILAHNHPSGSLRPSRPDLEITKRIVQAGKLLDITVLDHLIITPSVRYFSFADEGMI